MREIEVKVEIMGERGHGPWSSFFFFCVCVFVFVFHGLPKIKNRGRYLIGASQGKRSPTEQQIQVAGWETGNREYVQIERGINSAMDKYPLSMCEWGGVTRREGIRTLGL